MNNLVIFTPFIKIEGRFIIFYTWLTINKLEQIIYAMNMCYEIFF